MKKIRYTVYVLIMVLLAGLTGAQQAQARPTPIRQPVVFHLHHHVKPDHLKEQWLGWTAPASVSELLSVSWYNVHCYSDTVWWSAVSRIAPHNVAFKMGFTLHWCGGWHVKYGPSLWHSKSWDSAATVNGSIFHKTYLLATVLGYRYHGLDDTGNLGPSRSLTGAPYSNSSTDSVVVYRRWHWAYCPYKLPACVDFYPQIHLRAYPSGQDTMAGTSAGRVVG